MMNTNKPIYSNLPCNKSHCSNFEQACLLRFHFFTYKLITIIIFTSGVLSVIPQQLWESTGIFSMILGNLLCQIAILYLKAVNNFSNCFTINQRPSIFPTSNSSLPTRFSTSSNNDLVPLQSLLFLIPKQMLQDRFL